MGLHAFDGLLVVDGLAGERLDGDAGHGAALVLGLVGVQVEFQVHLALQRHGHVDGAGGQRLEAEDGAVLVALAPLQHHLQLVAVLLQVVRVLASPPPPQKKKQKRKKTFLSLGNRLCCFIKRHFDSLQIKKGLY